LDVDRSVQPLCAKIISLLQQERKRRKLSKYFIAQESGLSPQMVAYVENGERNPTLETVLKIASALQVDLAAIIDEARKDLNKEGKSGAKAR
jgi:transcriptional regulator with XRE-family HTH domain